MEKKSLVDLMKPLQIIENWKLLTGQEWNFHEIKKEFMEDNASMIKPSQKVELLLTTNDEELANWIWKSTSQK